MSSAKLAHKVAQPYEAGVPGLGRNLQRLSMTFGGSLYV